ncbi:hypothetical protein LL072_01615 [Lactobacillus delbrueckii subsp. lactis DSM 20072]|nr:hypothetical protein LL072_01615 [Lactobacillus delbrueckii subsp. lactis DSM 20072]
MVEKRANDLAQRLIRLAKLACPAVKKSSAHIRGLEMAINNILSAEETLPDSFKGDGQARSQA